MGKIFPVDGEKSPSSARPSLRSRCRRFFLGRELSPEDKSVFHRISLVAFFAWVGLGADPLSSSCYGPAEAFQALGQHSFLAIFVGLATALTIFIIAASYTQIVELFPSGGGGYLVASKLLSPKVGMVSGCALLIDYVLTITLSIASGADAVFSFLPPSWLPYKLDLAVLGVLLLTVLNLRGVKESITTLAPIFMIFVLTHAFVIVFGLADHLADLPAVMERTAVGVHQANAQLGLFGVLLLILHAYSMGAGTYTGLEAVSNGLPILREPRVETGKKTMLYMAVSLAVTVLGLIVGYILYDVRFVEGKTLNAVLFEAVTTGWGGGGGIFVMVTLVSEAALLFVAAQAGFVDGPRVLANMAQDRWFPTKFALLSDRLVTQNGILLMGGAALLLMIISRGSVDLLIILYSINVFITFVLSHLGMVRHWWLVRGEEPRWRKKILINGTGLVLTSFILVMITVVKFLEGGWATILVTGLLVILALVTRRHYRQALVLLRRLDDLVAVVDLERAKPAQPTPAAVDPEAKTAVILVNGYNGLGLHTLLNIHRLFPGEYENFVFLQVGQVDAGVFKGAQEVDRLKRHVEEELSRYVDLSRRRGHHAEPLAALGIDVIQEITKLAPTILERYPRAVFFGGQLVFPRDSFWTRLLHNYVVFAVQRQLYRLGVPLVIMPIRVG